jgi:hypothetical protein
MGAARGTIDFPLIYRGFLNQRRSAPSAGRHFLEVDDQRVFHAIDRVLLDPSVAGLEQMRHQAVIAGRT